MEAANGKQKHESEKGGNQELLPYAFCIIYARKSSDPSWQRVLRSCEALLTAAIRLSRQKRRRLPRETLLELMTFFDAQTLCRASTTCHSWHDICESDEFWDSLCRKQFNISFKTFHCKTVDVNINVGSKSMTKSRWGPKDLYMLADLNLKSMLRGTANSQPHFKSGFSSAPSRIAIPILVR